MNFFGKNRPWTLTSCYANMPKIIPFKWILIAAYFLFFYAIAEDYVNFPKNELAGIEL